MVTIAQAGIDTWSPAWRVDRESLAAGELDDLAVVGTKLGRMLAEPIAGHRVLWSSRSELLWAEGHPGGDRLLTPDRLPQAYADLVRELVAAGVPVPSGRDHRDAYGGRYDGYTGVRRVDSTVDLSTESTAEGLAILAGVAALVTGPGGGGKGQVVYGLDGRVETAYLRGRDGVRVLGRWYDKGVESGTSARGRLIRPEDQRRFVKGTRRHVSELTSEYVRAKFQQRFVPLWRASKGVTVAGPVVLADKLLAAIEAGELSAEQAEKLAGHMLLCVAAGRRGAGLARATRYRRERLMNDLGLVVADGCLEEVEVNLHDVMEAALDADAWTSCPQG